MIFSAVTWSSSRAVSSFDHCDGPQFDGLLADSSIVTRVDHVRHVFVWFRSLQTNKMWEELDFLILQMCLKIDWELFPFLFKTSLKIHKKMIDFADWPPPWPVWVKPPGWRCPSRPVCPEHPGSPGSCGIWLETKHDPETAEKQKITTSLSQN